jgi:hypothetical protein
MADVGISSAMIWRRKVLLSRPAAAHDDHDLAVVDVEIEPLRIMRSP